MDAAAARACLLRPPRLRAWRPWAPIGAPMWCRSRSRSTATLCTRRSITSPSGPIQLVVVVGKDAHARVGGDVLEPPQPGGPLGLVIDRRVQSVAVERDVIGTTWGRRSAPTVARRATGAAANSARAAAASMLIQGSIGRLSLRLESPAVRVEGASTVDRALGGCLELPSVRLAATDQAGQGRGQ